MSGAFLRGAPVSKRWVFSIVLVTPQLLNIKETRPSSYGHAREGVA